MSNSKMAMSLLFDCEKDAAVIEKLRSVDNKQGYIRRLILEDIGIQYDNGLNTKEEANRRRGKKAIDLTGLVFGRWTVIERDYEGSAPGRTMWFCRCECGNECSVIGQALRNGTSKQCKSCRGREVGRRADPRKRVNGKPTPTYNTWDAIIHRCYYPSQQSYKDYGGRGIAMCDEWKNDYFAFYDYVSKLDRFGEEGMTIDRIDNEKGYEPGNVRWATRAEQNRHRRDRSG